MSSEIEFDPELKEKFFSSDISLNLSNSTNAVVNNVASTTLSNAVNGGGSCTLVNKTELNKIKLKYENQLDEISECLGVCFSDKELGKLQAIDLVKRMSLFDISNIQSKILREKIYAAKSSHIEINHKKLARSAIENTKSFNRELALEGLNGGLTALDYGLDALGTMEAFDDFETNKHVSDLKDSLDIVSATIGITLTAADLQKGVSHFRKLKKLKKKLNAIEKQLEFVNKDLLLLEDKIKSGEKNYQISMYYGTDLKRKELEVIKYAIINSKKILKNKVSEKALSVLFSGGSACATLAKVVISRVGDEIIKDTGELALGSIVGALNIVEGGMELIKDVNDFNDLRNEQREIKKISSNHINQKVALVFNFVIKLKIDNLKNYQTQQVCLNLTDDVLTMIEGAASIAGETGAVGAQAVVVGAAATRLSLQVGNYLLHHKSDVEDFIHLKCPPILERQRVAYKLANLNKNVHKNTQSLQEEIQTRRSMDESARGLLCENIKYYKKIEKLKPRWELLDAQVTERLMIDRASFKLRKEAKSLSANIDSMGEKEFMDFKMELIGQGVLSPGTLHKSKDRVIKEVNKFIKGRNRLHKSLKL